VLLSNYGVFRVKTTAIYEAIEFCDGSNAEIMLAIDSSTTVNTPFLRATFRAYGDCDERPIPNTFT
jgi:hypothetical protein